MPEKLKLPEAPKLVLMRLIGVGKCMEAVFTFSEIGSAGRVLRPRALRGPQKRQLKIMFSS